MKIKVKHCGECPFLNRGDDYYTYDSCNINEKELYGQDYHNGVLPEDCPLRKDFIIIDVDKSVHNRYAALERLNKLNISMLWYDNMLLSFTQTEDEKAYIYVNGWESEKFTKIVNEYMNYVLSIAPAKIDEEKSKDGRIWIEVTV